MRVRYRTFLTSLIAISLALVSCDSKKVETLNAQNQALQQDLEQAELRLTGLQDILDQTEQENRDLKTQLSNTSTLPLEETEQIVQPSDQTELIATLQNERNAALEEIDLLKSQAQDSPSAAPSEDLEKGNTQIATLQDFLKASQQERNSLLEANDAYKVQIEDLTTQLQVATTAFDEVKQQTTKTQSSEQPPTSESQEQEALIQTLQNERDVALKQLQELEGSLKNTQISTENQEALDKAKAQIATLQDFLKSSQDERNALLESTTTLQKELEDSKVALEETKKQITQLKQGSKESVQDTSNTLSQELKQTQTELNEKTAQLEEALNQQTLLQKQLKELQEVRSQDSTEVTASLDSTPPDQTPNNNETPNLEFYPKTSEELESLIQTVSADSVIHLEGTYLLSQHLDITISLTLSGDGKDTSQLTLEDGDAVIRYSGEGTLNIQNLALSYTGTRAANVLEVNNGNLNVKASLIEGAIFDSQNELGGRGILLEGKAREVLLEEVVLQNNLAYGLEASSNTSVTINSSTFEANEVGLNLSSQAKATISESLFSNNTVNAIELGVESYLNIKNSQVETSGANGISVKDQAKLFTEQITVRQNETGILAEGEAEVIINTSVLRENRQVGVYFVENSSGSVENNTFEKNMIGIVVEDEATPSIMENQFEGNEQDIEQP